MASEYLKKLAEEQAKGIEETYGEGVYGSTAYIPKQSAVRTSPGAPPVPQPVKEERRTGNIWQQAISEATPTATQPENSRQNQRRSYTSPTTERTKENRRLYGMDTTLPEGRYSQITIPEATTNRRTVADIYNDTATMTRWRELAAKDRLTAGEKQEARAARKEIKSALGFFPSDVEGQGWKTRYSSDELPLIEELFGIDTSLNNRTNAGAGIMAGVVRALGIDWLFDRVFDLAGIRGEDGSSSPMKSTTTAIQKAQPGAFTVGNIAGSTAELLTISGAVGNAMKGVKWFTEAAPWIQKAISSGITFGINGLQSGITSTQTKEKWDEQERQNAALAAEFGAEYTPREYNPWKQVANVGISAGAGALAGAAGGALETVFGIGTSKALIRYGLQYNTLFRAIANGINGVGFAAGSTAIQEASKYLQYPEGYTASASEIASNLAVAFLFSSVSSVISDLKAAPQNRENLLKMMDELTREYAEVEMKMAGQTGQARRETAQRVAELTARIRNSVATSRGMSGVSNEIKNLVAALDIIDDRMAPIIAGGNGLLGAGDIMAQAEAAGFNPNTTLRLPAWDGTPSQPTNLEQAVQIVGANVPAPMGETVTVPEAPAQANNLPAWYAAYQNTTRPIDQPMQQRPNIPAPAAATPPLPQQSAQGNAATPPTPPVPQNAAQSPTEGNAPLTLPEDRVTMEPSRASVPPLPKQAEEAPAVEEAKQELRGTIRMPVQGKNVDALEQGAKTGELTMDSVSIGAKVPGFTREQQTSLATQIIEGTQSGQKEITAKVPDDGTFTVPNQPGAVAQVLNGLKVKANQEVEITQGIDRYLRNNSNAAVTKIGDQSYVGDKYALLAVSDSAADYTVKQYKANSMNLVKDKFDNMLGNIVETGMAVTEQPKVYEFGPNKFYGIETPQGVRTITRRNAEFIQGGQLYVSDNGNYLVSVNPDGSIRGFAVLSAKLPPAAKQVGFGKLKGISANDQKPAISPDSGLRLPSADVVQPGAEIAEESTVVNDNPADHTKAEQQVIEEYKNSVNEEVKEAFEKYLADPDAPFGRYKISDVTARQAEDAARLLGGDYSGYTNNINKNGITHILDEHGPNGMVNHSMADLNDAARIGYVLDNYDSVEIARYKKSGEPDFSKEFADKNNRPAPKLKFSKKVNGTYYVIEAVPESNYKKFWVVSAYIGDNNAEDITQAPDAPGPQNTPTAQLPSLPSAKDRVAQTGESVNTPTLSLPKEPEAPAKAEAPLKLPSEQKGENNGQVDLGRGNVVRGSDAGRRGSELPAEQPAEAEGLPRNGNRGEEQPGTGGEDAQGLRGNGAGRAGSDSGSVAGGDEGLSLPDDGGDAAGIRGKEPVKRPRNHNKRNYRLSQDIDSTRPSFRDNLAAIKLVKALQKEGRSPTPEEMDILAKYKGWGGLKTDVLGTGSGSYNAYQLRQVLTPEEYSDAKASVLNAHYTSTKVIDGIYSALARMGFSGGNILEPSMGVGNFFGRLPEKFSKTSDLYGVELDSITGAIAQYLYPDAKIDVAGFQDVLYPDGTFDLVVGNVPFSNQIKIPYRGSNYNLHDFFFLKALDEMKPGGVAALITSTGTLDKINGKVQKEIADRANLIAAFRLPDDAFKTNAGTSVTTDLLFLQKKGDDILDNGVAFGSIGEINGIPINEYYVEHPKNILGKLAREKGMYVSDRTVVHAEEGFEQRFEAAMKSLPKDIMKPGSQPKSGLVIPKKKGQKTKTEFKVTSDGAVVQNDGKATPVQNKKAEQTIKDYVQLKNTFNALIDAEKSGNVQGAEEYRRRLNEQYDSFAAKHGNLSDKNKKLLSTDDDFTKLSGLEIQTKDGISKSAIFTRPTISRAKRTSASSPQDALAASLNDTGKVDLPYMAKLTGRSVEDLAKDLEGDIVYTPDGDYVLTAQYVSGNIYEKLAALEGREGFETQKKMLEAAIPRRKGPEEINASLGSHWIPTETYTEFLREVFNLGRNSGEVSFNSLLGKWDFPRFYSAVSKYNAPGVAISDLVNQTLNGKNVTVYVKDEDGKRHLDTKATTVAQAKQDQLRQDFENWVFADKKRAEMLSDKYNRTMNAYAPMDYAELAKMLDTGISEDAPKQPRDYQKTAVARVVFGGNTLLHHGVGTGKTITMIVSAHVMKHNGIIHKPMFVVPNGKVNDFRTEILDLYPDASVLALDNDSMTPAQIKRTKAQIATGDWDYVIIYHSAFERLGITPETQKSFIEEQIAEYEEALRASREESGQRSDTRFEKNLAAKLKNLEEKLKDLSDQQRDDSTYFEDMGIDALFVDEAHNFKKVGFPTTFQISGIESGTNGKTTDLYMKENWLRRQGGRIILGTATPITNTLSEMYNMALHVNPDVYRDIGIYNFDTWLNTFADVSAKPEIGPDGKTWRIKERVRGFKNGNEMVSLYRQFADVIQTKDVVKGLPKAKYVTVVSEGTDLHQKLLDWFATRSGNPQGTDNMLLITSDGRAAGTDLRLLRNIINEVDPTATEEMLDLAGSKLNKCVDRVLDEYHKSSNRRGTQLIFLDLGIKAKEGRYGGISLYEDLIDKLVKNGIPRDEIANIQDYDGEEKRTELYDDMNSGKKRILIGSTAKMGEGVNAQRKIVAIHQLSVPYRADNLEQQEGRAIRFGNENDEVRIYRYIQEKSYDSYMWQMIERKAAYMSQALAGGDATELEEVGDIELSARESKAIATGNPLIVEKMELQDKAEKLRILQKNFYTEQALARKKAEQYPEIIKKYENEIKDIDEDIQTVEKSGKDFSITLGKTTYTERKEAAEALGKILKPANYGKTIGKVHGLDIVFHPGSNKTVDNPDSLEVRGKHSYTNEAGESSMGNLTRIMNLAEDAPQRDKKVLQGLIESANKQIEDAKKVLTGKFEKQEELDKVTARQREVDLALGIIENEGQVEAGSAGEIEDSRDVENFNGNNAPRHPENWKAERVGDKDKTPMSLTDIVNMIRHDFDIPVTTGNIRSPEARAQYRRQPQSVRSKIANSIPDIAHELGHHLDNIYDIRGRISEAAKQEIIDAMPESFKAAYKKEQLPGEGIAEFLRRYLQNSETAVMDYPKFSDELFKMLDSKARATLDKLADEVNAYYALSEQEGNWPVHNREDKGRDYRDLGEKLKDMNTHFRTLFIDSLEPIKQFDDESGGEAYLFATNAAYAGNRAYAAITGDLYDLRGNKLGVGLQKTLEGIHLNNKKEYTDFGMYLICRHGPERLAEGMRVFADDAWDNTAWMEQTAEELSEKYPAFEEAAERLEEYQHELIEAYGVASGLYSQETIDAWTERWEHYVPFLRWMGDKTGRTKGQKQGFANQTGPFRKARGSGLEIINPVDNIMENTVRLITASIRNEVMQKITEAASKMEGSGRWLEQVPMPLARKTWDGKGLKAKTLDEFDEYFKAKGKDLGEKGLDLIQQILDNAIDDLLVQYGRGKAHGDIVTVMKNGNPQYWKINDPDLLRSVTTMGPTRAGELLNYYGRVTRFVTGNITGMNIVWSIASNMPRDIGTMFTFSKTKNIAKLLAGIGESYVNRIKGDKANELYKEYMAMGGNSTSAQTADKDMAKKARKALQKQKTDWLNPLEWVEFVSDMIEAGPRYSYYKICRTKYNMTPEEAFYAAMEITVNFKKAGVLSREINILVPFFNASIQGVDRAARWLAADDLPKEERKAGRTRRIGVYLGASLAIAALSMGLNLATKRKRDNLEKLSTYTKNNYFIVPMKNGKYVAIPKPRELAIPISLFERMMEYYIGQNPHALDDFWEYATDNTLPGVISGIAQGDWNSAIGDLGVLGTFHYLTSNQDFLGRPIVPDSLAKMEPKDQYDQNTSQLAKMIGQAFNLSPKQIDFLGNNLFGGFWQWQKALAPVSGKSDITLGVQSKWIKDPLYSTDITNRMYDQREKLERLKNSNPDDIEIAARYRTINDLSSFYGRYYRLAKNEEETPQNRMIREAMLDTILGVEQNAEVEPARKFLMDVVEREGSTELMPAVMDVTVTGDDKTTYNLTSEEYFMHQTRYEALYYNYIRQAMDNQPKMTDEEKTSTVEAAKKIAGIVARGEAVEDHGGTYKAYTKVKDLLEDGVSEGELINYLSAKDNADLDGNGKVSNAELLHAAGALRIPTEKAASLIDYSESNSNLGLKLRTVDDYGVDVNEYALVLDALGDLSISQDHVRDAIDEVYGRTTPANKQEKAAMWQALGPTGKTAWKSSNNPYDTEVSEKVRNGLTIPRD